MNINASPRHVAEKLQARAKGPFSFLNISAFPEMWQFNTREEDGVFSSHIPAFIAAQVINNNQPLPPACSPIPLSFF